MPLDIIVSAKFFAGEKAIIVNESNGRAYYNIVKVNRVKSITPDVDASGADVITYNVEVYAPNTTNKTVLDVVETNLLSIEAFTAAFIAY